ncbi:hypothetical protein CFP56_017601 [Quercus suber]|uniref:50S ribosomal protein L18 n=1 Tax=Quercus suber TaxID=58331 RepID=A0AAW0KKS7_QUESU
MVELLKDSLVCGRSCNTKAAAVVGEVLAMRLRVEGLEQGPGKGIHVDLNKEVEKKGFRNRTKIWAIVNSLRNNGVKLILDDDDDDSTSWPSTYLTTNSFYSHLGTLSSFFLALAPVASPLASRLRSHQPESCLAAAAAAPRDKPRFEMKNTVLKFWIIM